MTLDQIDAQLAAAQAQLLAACADLVETYRTTVIPGLIAAIRANLFRPMQCLCCKKYYAVGVSETRAVMCCARELVAVLLIPPAGRGMFVPTPDQFVEPPAVVSVTPEIPW